MNLLTTSAGAGRIRWEMDPDLRKFTFLYWSGHDPADPDGDADTDPDHFDPEYYAQVILRATPYPAGPDEGHWKFLALVIQPDGIYLREWDKDAVTELGGAAVAIPKEQWHAVTIELSGANGETVTVKQALHNVSETQSIEATTTILDCEFVGFGVGEKANFRFDDVGTDKPVAGSIALRYHYDAYGRVVGRTLDPGGANVSQYFIYDNDRIVQELNTSGALVAEWVYGTYIDEILAMFRDTDGQPGLETYYYLQDDLYNVVALTDANGAVVERYTYDDYGAPTVWIEDSQNPGTWIEHAPNGAPVSDFGNPFMFTGRRWDEVLSLYDYRTRYYNPELGRFIGMDLIGPWGDHSNLGNPYAYVGNNPWSNLDPFGRAAKDVNYDTVVRVQGIVDSVFALSSTDELAEMTAQARGVYLHTQLKTKLDALENVILLTEAAIDETGTIVRGRPANSVVPDLMFIVLKKGESAQGFLDGSKSLRGHVDAILDLKTGKRGLRSTWTNEVAKRLGIDAADILQAKKGSNLVSLFGVVAEGTESIRLAAKLARGTGRTARTLVPIAGVLLAYQAARAQGWSQDEALAYATAAVVNADIAVDAAIFAQDSFKQAAEAYATGYDDAYITHLNDALFETTQVRGHEEGAYRSTEKLNAVLDRDGVGTTRAGDVTSILGN